MDDKIILVRNEQEFRRIGFFTLCNADFVAVRLEEGYKIIKDRFGSNEITVKPPNTFFHTLNDFVNQTGFSDISAINQRLRETANSNRRIWREQYDLAGWLKKIILTMMLIGLKKASNVCYNC